MSSQNQTPLNIEQKSINSEDDLQNYIEHGMESNGYTVIREIKPHYSNFRADIVAQHDSIGTVGIECKYVTGGPIVAAEAARQVIDKYAGQKFVNWKVDVWGICLFGRCFRPDSINKQISDRREIKDNSTVETTKRIMNGFGLGWVTAHDDRVVMEFLPSGRDVCIPLFHSDGENPEWFDKVDMERIESLVEDRRPD